MPIKQINVCVLLKDGTGGLRVVFLHCYSYVKITFVEKLERFLLVLEIHVRHREI